VGGFAGLVWNVITVSMRQALVPDHLLGRVNSAYRLIGWGTMPLGALAGGLLADAFGLRAPFLVGGVAALLLAGWHAIAVTNRAIGRARRRATWADEETPDAEIVLDDTIDLRTAVDLTDAAVRARADADADADADQTSSGIR
ncbi:MAG: hypothetical protein ACXV8T_17610, partial [Acidimicrobiia bacterium]